MPKRMDERRGPEALDLTLSLAVGGTTRPKAEHVTQHMVFVAVKALYHANRTGSTRDQVREYIAQQIFRGMVPEPEDAFSWVVDAHLLALVENAHIEMFEQVLRRRDVASTSRNPPSSL
ncbi:hypothetical protein KP509_32G031100 [Ceratopteris richardii]|uniref:Uncharacterized protein n=1 Tax=Ceratopteris richardii TaxID=49495 RepID=A0A8T2QSS2_CERRI|nr:hypothetical protein KP509_32G031100 [Ceratopteris richardii]